LAIARADADPEHRVGARHARDIVLAEIADQVPGGDGSAIGEVEAKSVGCLIHRGVEADVLVFDVHFETVRKRRHLVIWIYVGRQGSISKEVMDVFNFFCIGYSENRGNFIAASE
jgi:hypothetical protein